MVYGMSGARLCMCRGGGCLRSIVNCHHIAPHHHRTAIESHTRLLIALCHRDASIASRHPCFNEIISHPVVSCDIRAALVRVAPRARSGFLMTVHPSDDAIFVFGGYSKEKITASASSAGGGGTSGKKKSEGKIHTDMWMLSLKGVVSSQGGASRLDVGKISWQKLSNKGAPPSTRCGASMTSYKNKGIYFGGVNDR